MSKDKAPKPPGKGLPPKDPDLIHKMSSRIQGIQELLIARYGRLGSLLVLITVIFYAILVASAFRKWSEDQEVVATQVSLNLTATAIVWTNTPTATPSSSATSFPTPFPTATFTSTATSTAQNSGVALVTGVPYAPPQRFISIYCPLRQNILTPSPSPTLQSQPIDETTYLYFWWQAPTEADVLHFLRTAQVSIDLDGLPIRADWPKSATNIFKDRQDGKYKIAWFIGVGKLSSGKHDTTLSIQFTEPVQGDITFTPDDSFGMSCHFIVR